MNSCHDTLRLKQKFILLELVYGAMKFLKENPEFLPGIVTQDPPVEVKKSMAEQWNPDGNVHDSPLGLF